MYVLLYLAALVLRYKQPKVKRPYKVPFGNFGMWVISLIGMAAIIFAIIVGFYPPSQLTVTDPKTYVGFLIIGTIVFVAAPIIINSFKKPQWVKKQGRKK
jgi:amino acid transporter